MKVIICMLVLAAGVCSGTLGDSLSDCTGVIRVFGDASSWMSSCFVVGDGSWVITTSDAIVEKPGPDTERAIRYPIFISHYNGQAYQCELKAHDRDLNLALLKLPVKGLPAAPLAQMSEFSKAAYGTMGQLMSGEPIGNLWSTEIYGITREKKDEIYRLEVSNWNAKKVFVTDIGKYKWPFLSDITPDTAVPNGSMVVRLSNVVGLYINKLTITGGKMPVKFGRCVMSTEIASYLGKHGVDTATLYTPPKATIQREENADAAFQLQAKVYSQIGIGRADLALGYATDLVKILPKDAYAQMALGVALTGAGKFDDALKVFDEAAKLEALLPTLRTNRALALVGLQKRTEAEAELLKAAEEAPSDVRPVTALADFYLGDDATIDKALTYAKKATTMASDSPATLLLRARAEKRKKNYQDSINTIGEAIKLAPEWGDAYFALGSTFEQAGDKTNAETAYRKLVEKQPKNASSLLTLASFLADSGQKDEPIELITKVRALNPPKEVLDTAQALEDKIQGKKPAEEKPSSN